MGRKAKFGTDVVKKGPGRKAKKQKDPAFPKHLTGMHGAAWTTIFNHLVSGFSKIYASEVFVSKCPYLC